MFSRSNEELAAAPPLEDTIECPHCGNFHIVRTTKSEKGTMSLQSYRCGEKTYLAGIDNKSVMGGSK